MSHPRISVLLPAFDAETTLGLCLESLLRQREPRWECVLVDDGSSDGTLALSRCYAARDARIRVVSRPHRGLVAALASGLEHCRAPLVARMDADDWMHRDRLAAQDRRAMLDAQPQLAGVGCHVRTFPRAGLTQGRRAYESWLCAIESPAQLRRDAFVECPVAHPSLMLRRSLLQRFGFRECGWPEDYDLVLRLLLAGHEIGVVARRLLAWRDHPQRLSRTSARYAREAFTACKADHLRASLLAGQRHYILWGYGDTGRALRRALARLDRHPSHIVELHPGRLGQRIHGAPVVRPEQLRVLPRLPIVASVAGPGPRAEIRAALTAMGFAEERDFVCAA